MSKKHVKGIVQERLFEGKRVLTVPSEDLMEYRLGEVVNVTITTPDAQDDVVRISDTDTDDCGVKWGICVCGNHAPYGVSQCFFCQRPIEWEDDPQPDADPQAQPEIEPTFAELRQRIAELEATNKALTREVSQLADDRNRYRMLCERYEKRIKKREAQLVTALKNADHWKEAHARELAAQLEELGDPPDEDHQRRYENELLERIKEFDMQHTSDTELIARLNREIDRLKADGKEKSDCLYQLRIDLDRLFTETGMYRASKLMQNVLSTLNGEG